MAIETMNKKTIRMKNLYRLPIISSLVFLCACQQNEVMDFSISDRIYFNETTSTGATEEKISAKNYSFALQNSSLMEDTLKLKTKLMGYLSERDRVFRAEVLADSTTAVEGFHYNLLDGVLRAGQYESYLPVVLYRTADTQEAPVTLHIRLIATEDLEPGHPEDIYFTLSWGDILMKPEHWPEYFFGTYSVNKYRFAIDVTGHTDWPQAERVTSGKQEGIYTITEIQREADKLNDAYEEYRKTNGPIYEDDNADPKIEIYFGSN